MNCRRDHDAAWLRALPAITAVIILSTRLAAADPVSSATQDSVRSGGTSNDRDAQNNNNDLTRPQNSFDVRFQYRTPSETDSTTDREMITFRVTNRIELNSEWKLSSLAQIPVANKRVDKSDPSSSETEFGIGDAAFQAVLIHTLSERWAFGFGFRLVAPTAEDNLGSGKWQIMPGFGVRYSLPELGPDSYFVPAVRYAVSFAGDPARRNISEPQIAPTLNIGLPNRWFLTFYPSYDIRINYGDPISGQKGRLFLPLDLAVGRQVSDSIVMSLEISVPIIKEYPVYDFKTELRLVAKY